MKKEHEPTKGKKKTKGLQKKKVKGGEGPGGTDRWGVRPRVPRRKGRTSNGHRGEKKCPKCRSKIVGPGGVTGEGTTGAPSREER